MPSPFQLVSARPWHAKSVTRQLAEVNYEEDRTRSHLARESWKTQTQLMYNDLANAMESASMMSEYGPTSWGREMFAMGLANANMGALSTVPPYVSSSPAFPIPLVNHASPLPLLPPTPAIMPGTLALPSAMPILPPVSSMSCGMGGMAASLVNDIPISVGPQIPGYTVMHVLGPADAIAPPTLGYSDISIQRLNAVEMLVNRAAALGGNGVINLRLVTDAVGSVTAMGDAVRLMPFM